MIDTKYDNRQREKEFDFILCKQRIFEDFTSFQDRQIFRVRLLNEEKSGRVKN